MQFLKSTVIVAAFAITLPFSAANAAEPIVGQWRAPTGNVIKVASCGGAYCATVITGQNKGKRIGRLSGSGANYRGTVTDPESGKTYEGTATIARNGSSLKLTGCALKIFCKTQTWNRI